jgi:hypothetical protein
MLLSILRKHALIYVALTSSILQLAIYSNVEIVNVDCLMGN